MATEAEFRQSYLDRADVVHISDSFPLGKDADRQAINACLRRRFEATRTDAADGKLRIFYVDYGLTPNGDVVEAGAGEAKEPTNPEDVFRAQAEAWLAANARTADSNIRTWWITGVDESRMVARVTTLYAEASSFTEKPFVAFKAEGQPVEFKPLI